MSRRGSVTLYVVFIIVAIVIVTIAAVLAPMGVLFNEKMIEAGEGILLDANDSIANINDASVRSSVYDIVSTAVNASEDNIEIQGAIFQYSWVFVVLISMIVVFLSARKLVEYENRGGGFV